MGEIRICAVKIGVLHDVDHFFAVGDREDRFAEDPAENHRMESGGDDKACAR
ncbi:hypothetical protein D3C72_2591930 [compost metagenome]